MGAGQLIPHRLNPLSEYSIKGYSVLVPDANPRHGKIPDPIILATAHFPGSLPVVRIFHPNPRTSKVALRAGVPANLSWIDLQAAEFVRQQGACTFTGGWQVFSATWNSNYRPRAAKDQ